MGLPAPTPSDDGQQQCSTGHRHLGCSAHGLSHVFDQKKTLFCIPGCRGPLCLVLGFSLGSRHSEKKTIATDHTAAMFEVADGQKFAFRGLAANKGKFIQSGLWTLGKNEKTEVDIKKKQTNPKRWQSEIVQIKIRRYSRHPNYFGEILMCRCWVLGL